MPTDVMTVEAFGPPEPAPLLGDERAAVARAVPARRAEYAAARACARDALAALGHGRPAVPTAPDRSPVWPSGVVGAITHCAGYRGVVVARADAWLGVGVDAEPHAPLPAGVGDLVMSADERAHVARVGVRHADRVLFCAKEAVYKVWYPAVGMWLGFEDVRVRVGDGTFVAHLDRPDLGVDVLTGRWATADGIVVAALAQPR